MQHYRCMQCFMPQKRSDINVDTLVFIPYVIPIPSTTVEDFIRQATGDIITLTNPPKSTTPILQLGDTTRNGLLQVTNLLNRNHVTSTVFQHQHQLTANTAARLLPLRIPPTSTPTPVPSPVPSPTQSVNPSFFHQNHYHLNNMHNYNILYSNLQGCSSKYDLQGC